LLTGKKQPCLAIKELDICPINSIHVNSPVLDLVRECHSWLVELIHPFHLFFRWFIHNWSLEWPWESFAGILEPLVLCCVLSLFVCIIVLLQARGPSKRKHVHGCNLVRAKKLYGYHSSEELFMKIYLYPLFTHFHKPNIASTNVYTSQHYLSHLFLYRIEGI
jgi:hypothetical protein